MTEAALSAMKAVVWEEAKGKLRALVALEGHRRLCEPAPFDRLEADGTSSGPVGRAVEEFIRSIEEEELQA